MKTYFEIACVFLITFFVTSFFATMNVDPHHDGIILKPALDVVSGKILFKETFTYYGALTTFIHAFSLLLFGNYLLSIRLTTAFFYSLTAIFLFLIWSRFLPKWQTFIAIILWILLAPYYFYYFHPWPSVYALFFLVVTLYLFILYCDKAGRSFFRKNLSHLFLIGITSALSFWSKQSYAVLIAFIAFFFVCLIFLKVIKLKTGIKNILVLSTGFFSVNFIFLTWFLITGSLKDWFLQSVRVGYILGRVLGRTYNILDIIFSLAPHVIWLIFPLVCLFLTLKSILLISKNIKDVFGIRMLGVSLICIASLLQYYPLYDFQHTYWAATPTIGFFIYFLNSLISKKLFRQIKLKNIFSIILVLIFISLSFLSLFAEIEYRITTGLKKAKENYVQIDKPAILKGIKMKSSDAVYYESISKNIDDYLIKHPEKDFVILWDDALYMTFTNKAKNTGSMYANFSGATSGVYPYEPMLNEHIKESKPLILAHDFIFLEGYQKIAEWKDKKTALIAPVEKLN